MSKRRRPGGSKKVAEAKFWGKPVDEEIFTHSIRPTPEPGAIVRSLGYPPLAVEGAVAQRHLVAVYEEAVKAATALAAAGGLLAQPTED